MWRRRRVEGEQSEVSETVRGGIVHSLPLSIGGELPRPPVALGSGIQGLWSLVAFIHSSPLESSLSRAMTGNDTTFYLINHDNSSFTLTNNSPSLTHTLSLSFSRTSPTFTTTSSPSTANMGSTAEITKYAATPSTCRSRSLSSPLTNPQAYVQAQHRR